MKKGIRMICLILCLSLCIGCGHKQGGEQTADSNSSWYRIKEYVLPKAEESLKNTITESGLIFTGRSIFHDGTFIRLTKTFYEDAAYWFNNPDLEMPEGECRQFVQVLRSPYNSWENYELSDNQTPEEGIVTEALSLLDEYSNENPDVGSGTMIRNPVTGETFYDSLENDGASVRNAETGEYVIGPTMEYGFRLAIAFDNRGEMYAAATSGIYLVRGKEKLETLVSFQDRDYLLDSVDFFEIESDIFRVVTSFGGLDYLLEIQKTEEKQKVKSEITVAVSSENNMVLKTFAARFNRQSNLYHVTLTQIPGGSGDEQRREIQLLLAKGQGPDLLDSTFLSIHDLADGGYLESLDFILEQPERMWKAALSSGSVGGQCYGIPYACFFEGMYVFRNDITKGRERWTAEEMMQSIRDSGAKWIADGMPAVGIVCNMILTDVNNRKIIDWEQNQSNLDGALFGEILQFAKEYARNEEADYQEYGNMRDGVAAGSRADAEFTIMSIMQRQYDALGGNIDYIGNPCESGSGAYVRTECLCLNSKAQNREGAIEFLKFMVSDDSQQYYVKSCDGNPLYALDMCLPLQREAVDEVIQRWVQDANEDGKHEDFALRYERALRYAIENACAYPTQIDDIRDIVIDEIMPYLRDERSLDDTLRVLDNRIQLYLNERKDT